MGRIFSLHNTTYQVVFQNTTHWVVKLHPNRLLIAMTPLRHPSRPHAFTLIELLAVIAIIGLLAAILIPVTGKVRMVARKGRAISDLRQVGVAILQYANERKDQRVPGAGPLGITVNYTRTNSDPKKVTLGAGLAPYLGNRDPDTLGSSEKALTPQLVCPGVEQQFPDLVTSPPPHYVQNFTLKTRYTNGVQNARVLGTEADPENRPPVALHELETLGGPARVWVLTNLDLSLHTDNAAFSDSNLTSSGWYTKGRIPETPVWGNARLRLYLDAHVASVPRDADP
ncbi:N-terminal cleavage protein [Opitutaceae bacterium TAV5]|nr:N-terminal cleavage protein [Opitutaceae bacterium TAV5]